MAYNDYGSFVYLNGERQRNCEDVPIYNQEEYSETPAGARIYQNICNADHNESRIVHWANHSHHGVLGNGNIRLGIYKDGLWHSALYKKTEDGTIEMLSGYELLKHLKNADGSPVIPKEYENYSEKDFFDLIYNSDDEETKQQKDTLKDPYDTPYEYVGEFDNVKIKFATTENIFNDEINEVLLKLYKKKIQQTQKLNQLTSATDDDTRAAVDDVDTTDAEPIISDEELLNVINQHKDSNKHEISDEWWGFNYINDIEYAFTYGEYVLPRYYAELTDASGVWRCYYGSGYGAGFVDIGIEDDRFDHLNDDYKPFLSKRYMLNYAAREVDALGAAYDTRNEAIIKQTEDKLEAADDESDEYISEWLYGNHSIVYDENGKTIYRGQRVFIPNNLSEESTMLSGNYIDAEDYVEILREGMRLAREGYDSIEVINHGNGYMRANNWKLNTLVANGTTKLGIKIEDYGADTSYRTVHDDKFFFDARKRDYLEALKEEKEQKEDKE